MRDVNDPAAVDAILKDCPDLASSAEIGQILRVEPGTITKWIRHGELKGIKIGSRTTRVRREDLRTFLLRADEMNLSD